MWQSSDFLSILNPRGKQPIDYIIESKDDKNLLAFLVFDFEEDDESDSVSQEKKYFLMIKNDQYRMKTGMSLFQKFYTIKDQQTQRACLSIMGKLLTEMVQIDDINGQTAISEVLKMENDIFRHEILKRLTAYWLIDSQDYDHYKAILSDISPYYRLILTIKENNLSEFEELFPKYLEITEQIHESIVQGDCNFLLEIALSRGQRKVIDAITDCQVFDANKFLIKSDLSLVESKDTHYLMSRLLQNGYYLGNDGFLSDWITFEVLKDFLDSRVIENGKLKRLTQALIGDEMGWDGMG